MTVVEGVSERVVREVATIFKKSGAEVSRDTRFAEDLDAKSVNYVQLIAVLNDAFGIDIPFMDLRRQRTVGEAIDFVARLRGS